MVNSKGRIYASCVLLRIYQAIVPKRFRPREVANRQVKALSGGKIIAGPFRGMRYFEKGDAWSQRILGTYEIEIREAIQSLLDVPFNTIVDVGAADGFYAVGFARLFPAARSVAFEMLLHKQPLIRELAELNGVQLDVRGEANPRSLSDLLSELPCLVFIDAEGAEAEILDPAISPGLTSCHILVELHEFARPGLPALLESRFSQTHAIQRFPRRPRTAADLPFKPGLLKPWYMSMMADGRPYQQEWWLMTPR